MAFRLGASCELVTNAAAGVFHNRFEIASRFQQRPQAPPGHIYKTIHLENGRGIDLVETMENALPGFEERSVVEQGLEPSGRWGRFPQPRVLNLVYLSNLRRSHP